MYYYFHDIQLLNYVKSQQFIFQLHLEMEEVGKYKSVIISVV